MTPHAGGYSEDQLIEQPTIELLKSLGWETANCFDEFDQPGGSPLKRENKSEVILRSRLLPAVQKLNPTLPSEAFEQVMEQLERDRSRLDPARANREVYELVKSGVRVKIQDPKGGGETDELVRLIDWDNPRNNDFFLASQFWIAGEMYTRRADLVGFVNGLPLVFIELKAAHRRLEHAYYGNLKDYKDTIPHTFWYNSVIILSNGSQSKIGSMTASWEHFADWKKITSEGEKGIISLETMIRGTCDPERLLDLVENFTLFQEVQGGLIKVLAKNHQYLGVSNAMKAMKDIKKREGKLGVFWHTQGSGKSMSMIFFAQKVLRKVPGNWTFVVVTDRMELDKQIYKNFVTAGAITEAEAHAESGAHLRQLLSEDHRYVFTLIQKFQTNEMITDREDIIVITDESHRSQYDTLAMNMRSALPKASFIAFTGTPLIAGEELTKNVFGDYVSIYDFKQSADDGATVPLYYENRIPELQLTNENLNQDMETLLEEAELDADQEKKLEREFAREYHLITRDDRLETISKDLVSHFMGRGFQGKAMVVSIDKATAVKMYDKVQKYWKLYLEDLQGQLKSAKDEDKEILKAKIEYMKQTDMAVVVSPSQNEIETMRQKGVSIEPHRRRMNKEDLDTKFKNADDPFRIVFVCAMWMTGFDVPSCSTIYLDKPMRNHTLMQTIARANRVFKDKVNGLIVDYVGVFRNLEKALAIYGVGGGEGAKPALAKKVLIEKLRGMIQEAKDFCTALGIDLEAIKRAQGFEAVKLMDAAVEAILVSDESKKRYLTMANNVRRFYKAILPDVLAKEFSSDCKLFHVLAQKIISLSGGGDEVDISALMGQVENLLDRSVATEGYVIREPAEPYGTSHQVDLSKIDFEKLKKHFEEGRKRIQAEQLKSTVGQILARMLRLNRTRMDYMERFQEMIAEYNSASVNVDEFFKRLMAFTKELKEEDRRAIGESLKEEELALFDILTKPPLEMTEKERQQVKKAARDLLQKLKREKLVLDWRKRQQSRAEVRVAIEKTLDHELPPVYSTQLFQTKCDAIYQHVFESYYGAGRSIYEMVA